MEYGLIGEHLPHSFSKEIHALCADYEYSLCELAPSELGGFMEKCEFKAINVTIPYKEAVIPHLYEIHRQAKEIGAVNTVVKKDGRLYGYNTDFYGLLALVRKLGISQKGKKVLILGMGGTAKTALAVSKSEGAREIILVGRNTDASKNCISYEEMYRDHTDAEIIFNTTPCGMFPFPDGSEKIAACAVDLSRFTKLCGAIDAVYNPVQTNFVLDAKKLGVPAEGGLYMLVAQAVIASKVFLGESIETALNSESNIAEIDKIYKKILKEKENIVLIGMPSCGKTTVGQALAKKLGRQFVDTDALIVEKENRKITEIFADIGEKGFRDLETEAVRLAANSLTGAVIATGGGAILRDENVRALKRSGKLYFINRELSHLVPTKGRPLASDRAAIEARYRERYPRYVEVADREILTDENIEHTVNSITEDFYK